MRDGYIIPKYRRRNRNWLQRMWWKIRHPWWYVRAICMDYCWEQRVIRQNRERFYKENRRWIEREDERAWREYTKEMNRTDRRRASIFDQ